MSKKKKKPKPEKVEKPVLRLQNKHPPHFARLKYDAAQTTVENMKHWSLADSLSADASNTPEVRRTLRNRARYEVASNSYARGMVMTLAATCIGTGPRLQLLSEDEDFNSLVETEFIAWAEAVRLCEKLQTLRMAKITDGEAFAAIVKNPRLKHPVEIDIRAIEADRITSPYPSVQDEVEGIEYDKFGNPMRYHVSSKHPSDSSLWYGKFETIDAEYMLHWYRTDRPGQSRGLPEIMPALPLFAQLRRYTLAVLAAAETAADFAAVLYTDAPAGGEAQPLEAMDMIPLEKRMATILADGWKLGQVKAEHPNTTYSEFKREILGEIGRCMQVPVNILLGDSSKHNYASGRLDHQTFFKSIKVEQAVCEQVILYPLFNAWYREALRIGLFGRKPTIPRHQQNNVQLASWHWDGMEHVDPMKEANAASKRIQTRTSNLAIECAKAGLDWEDVLSQAAKERKRMIELGLILTLYSKKKASNMKRTMKLTSLMLEPGPITLVQETDSTNLEAGGQPSLPAFTLVAYTGGKAQPKDFPCPIVVDLQGIDVPNQKIPVRFEHKSFQGVGHTEKIAVIGREVLAEGIISRDTSWARDVTQSARNGFPWQASMGGPIHQTEYVPFGQEVTVNGQTFEGELYIIRKMTLKEISFVDLAADEHTSAVIEAQLEEKENLEMTKSSENQSEQKPDQTPENKQETRVSTVAPVSQIDTVKMMAEFQQKMLIDQRRIAAIEKIGGGKLPDLEAKAIEDGWAVEKFHAEYQSQTMPDATTIPVTGTQQHQGGLKPTALEAIALATGGSSMAFLESQYEPKTLEQIDKFRGVGIQEFCELACGGRYLPKYRRDSRGWLEAAFSSVSLPGILSNIANKVLLEGFLTMDDTWKKIAKIASVNNFQQHRQYRMNGAFKFEKVGPDGEIKHGQISEQAFSQQVDTFAIMFALTRQMIIDDDLGAFSDIPRGIGVGAAEAISDAVWECVVTNAQQSDGKKFFSTDHKNIVTGAEAKLGINGLTKAELAFSEQERVSGRPLGIPARILLVPSALKVVAETLMKSLTVNETTDKGEPKPVDNPHAGKYEVVSTPYLSSKAIKGGSPSAWYLFADPLRLAALEVAFLGGQDRPTVERADADFNTFGIQFRGYIDFGVKEQDWRGALKCDG